MTTSPRLRVLAGPGVPVRPVVKADAYGHGALPVALALEAAGADGFCVAAFDEALELREGGVRAPITVLYPVPVAFAAEAAERDIAVAAGDRRGLAATIDAAARLDPLRPLGVELEIETGLGRGGFAVSEVADAAREVTASRGLRLAGLWTHLQAAHDPAITAAQVAAYDAAVSAVRDGRDRAPECATWPPARRSSPTACWPMTACAPGWRSTASSPTSWAPPARREPEPCAR